MPDTLFYVLPGHSRPLLNKFYQEHKSSMRAGGDAQVWVAKRAEIVGGLCLTAVADGHWLTGLFVAPSVRGQTIARRLLDEVRAQTAGPVWLFCHPDLTDFYQRAGYELTEVLPEALSAKFERYCQTKSLVALSNRDARV
ncbi:MAG: GNAT family N-acetyltransferase [Pseudomonas sp.]